MRPIILAATMATSFAALATAPRIAAADAALILVQSNYASIDDVPGANHASALAQLAQDAGFEVTASLDGTARETAQAISEFKRDAEDGERVMILVSGHVMSDGTNTWLLTNEARDVSRFNVGSMAVPMGPLMEITGEFPGQGVMMISAPGDDVGADDLTPIATMDAAQGVTVITGPLDRLTRMTRENLLVPGLPLTEVINEAPRGVEGSGYISSATSFLPAEDGSRVVIERSEQRPEDAFWVVARTMDNADGYDLYLQYFPDGAHNTEARAALRQIENDQVNQDEAAEAALNLNQAARRQVQRNLALLGHDPKGIDGIFGPATRSAIRSYQSANGYAVTGYLSRDMLSQMTSEADARAAQLEREAAERQARQEREDRDYWNRIGKGQDEAGLRAYLDRYPDGLFSEVARSRLDEIEASKRSEAEAAERSFWDRVRQEDKSSSYRAYLDRYPNGLFAEEARARLGELNQEQNQSNEMAIAQDEEKRVAGNTVTRLLVETRLATLGIDPGPVDGNFDRDSRRAIRRFQNARGLPVTGYVTQQTMVRLLAAF